MPQANAEEAKVEQFYQDLQDLLELTPPKKRCPFHYRGMECKSRTWRNTWSNRQIWPWSTEWSRKRLIEFCQGNTQVIANTLFQQHKRRLYTWTSPDDWQWRQMDYILQPKMEKLCTVSKNKTGTWLGLGSWTPYLQIQNEIEEVEKKTRPLR